MKIRTRNPGRHSRSILRASRAIGDQNVVGRTGGQDAPFEVFVRLIGTNGLEYEIAIPEDEIEALKRNVELFKAEILKEH